MTTDKRSICPLVSKWRTTENETSECDDRWNCADELAAWLPKVQAVIEAGQAMRDDCGGLVQASITRRQAWDKALADLLGQKKG
jgi:hypothetical protein